MTQLEEEPRVRKRSAAALVPQILLAAAVVGLIVAYSMYFQVEEGYKAVVTRFGDPVRSLDKPGLAWKWPWPVERVHQIDVRRRVYNTPYTATLTRDQKNVILLTYAVWRVENPLLFLQSLGTAEAAEQKLDGMVAASKNFHLGRYELSALVSTTPGAIQTEAIEEAILADVSPAALSKFGIAIEQVGIKRIAYPEENIATVLQQMRAERRAEAGKLRAEGEREAQQIRDEVLVKCEEIRRLGREEAGKIQGQAEKEAAEIYARAHRLDPDFYRFWRSLQAMKKTLGSKSTIILRTDQGFFDVLSQPPGAAGTAPAASGASGAAGNEAAGAKQAEPPLLRMPPASPAVKPELPATGDRQP
ncbi:MAG: protease modulator HflC [Candidatus Anammoximicrobium sp.]|nr:protease modulator HflC [Candidatus Anammoximicrobium sp.]